MSKGLHWTPLADPLFRIGQRGILLISPFVQQPALKQVVESFSNTDSLQVVTRWEPADIISGVSDLEVYPYLKERGIPLYIHSRIHLKLTVFDGDRAFHSSANITNRGLGLTGSPNIEIGSQVELVSDDWLRIYELLEGSIRVDDSIYEQALQYLSENKEECPPLPKLTYHSEESPKEFSRHSLPFVQDPDALWVYYSEDKFDGSRAKFVHDLMLYSVQRPGLGHDAFFQQLEVNFKAHPFINSIAQYVRHEGELRFGAVNNWITEKCTDKPVPFRWEVKPITNRLYNWLDLFYKEISWSVPGKRSQVIRWKD